MTIPALLISVACGWAQPPLPPEERPHVIGTVVRVSQADGLALDTGLSAPLSDGLQITGAGSLQEIAPGDLVEVVQDANGLVTALRLMPRLAQRMPLIEATSPRVPLSRFWWTHDGQDFPDSLYAADAAIALQAPAVVLEGTVAYVPEGTDDAAEFAVLDNAGAVLWSRRLSAGGTASLRCPLQGAAITLRCRRPDGSTPDHTHCIWGSPTVLLKELGLIALPPKAADDLAARLDASLKGVDPGAIGIAQPRVIGLSPQLARDLQQDLLVSLGSRHAVTGFMPWEAGPQLTDGQRQAAQTAQAASVAVSELRYSPEGSVAKVSLVHVASGEALASAETTIAP